MEGNPAPDAPGARRLVALFMLCLGLYWLNGRALSQADCIPAPYLAWSLMTRGSSDLRAYPELEKHLGMAILERPDGGWMSRYPPGSALVAMPVLAPLAAVRESVPTTGSMRNLGKLVASLCVAGAVVLFYLVALQVAPGGAVLATALFAFGTTLTSVGAQALWTHGPATFWLCLAMWLSLRASQEGSGRSPGRSFGAGLALGCAILTRPTTAVFTLSTTGWLLLGRRAKALALTLAGVAIPVLGLLVYNHAVTGNALSGGYGSEASEWDQPFWIGLAGLLIAPSRGLLIYSPALWLVPIGLAAVLMRGVPADRNERTFVLAWSAGAFGQIFLYANWHAWSGGWSYGPRYLIEALPPLCLLFALAVERLHSRLARHGATALVAVSITIQVFGIFGSTSRWDDAPAGEHGSRFFELHDTQIEAHARAFFARVVGSGAPQEGSTR
jgi:hypothetical protein